MLLRMLIEEKERDFLMKLFATQWGIALQNTCIWRSTAHIALTRSIKLHKCACLRINTFIIDQISAQFVLISFENSAVSALLFHTNGETTLTLKLLHILRVNEMYSHIQLT